MTRQRDSRRIELTDQWTGDGVTSRWPLSHDLDPFETVTLTVAGLAKTVEVTTDPDGATKQFALFQTRSGHWILEQGVDAVPPLAAVIVLSYLRKAAT